MVQLLVSAALAVPVDVDALKRTLGEVAPIRAQRGASKVPQIPDASRWMAAQTGKVETGLVEIPGHAARLGWGVGAVDVNAAKLMAALSDDQSKPNYTSLERVVLVDGRWCAPKRRVLQFLPMGLVTDRWWVVDQAVQTQLAQASAGRMLETTWHSVEDPVLSGEAATVAAGGISIAFTQGAWLLIPLGPETTWVEYHAWSDPGGSVPAALASRFAASGIPDAIAGMVALAKAGPRCAVAPG